MRRRAERPGSRNGAIWIAALLTLLFAPGKASAIEARDSLGQYVQTTLTARTGLPQNSVRSIAQTADGYLWMATEEGLARYDGVRVTLFNSVNHPGMPDNYINAIAGGPGNTLWIGSRRGLSSLRDGVVHNYLPTSEWITTVVADGNGTVWGGGVNGLYRLRNGRVRLFTSVDGLPGTDVHTLADGKGQGIWIGTTGGVARIQNGEIHRYGPEVGMPAEPVEALDATADGSLWAAFPSELVHWQHGAITERWPMSNIAASDSIVAMRCGMDGSLWVALEHGGVARLKDGQWSHYTTTSGLPSDNAAELFRDHDGHIWIGFVEAGVLELRRGMFRTIGVQEGLSSSMVWTVRQAHDDSLWVGTEGRGLNHVLPDGSVQVYSSTTATGAGPAKNSVYGIDEDASGVIWYGSDDGRLISWQNGRQHMYHDPGSNGRLLQILPAPDGDLWLAFHETNGLVRFHKGVFTHYGVPGVLNTIAAAADGSLWLGADYSGVTHWNGRVLENYSTEQGLLSRFCQSIYIDREGTIWAGTSPGGLNRIKGGHITTYSLAQGLFDLTVGAIIEDNHGNLWMTCNKGIFRVAKSELNAYASGAIAKVHSVVYGISDGMRAAECNFGAMPSIWKDRDGRLWFATVAGIASIDPRHSDRTTVAPRTIIEGAMFNHNALRVASGIQVGPGAGDLEILYTAPEYTAPETIRFRYMLQDFDKTWVNADDRREAYYAKLPPGRYTFIVQSSINGGAWSTTGASLEVHALPHLWETRWFIAAVSLLLVGLCVWGVRWRLDSLTRQNLLLEERVRERTRQLQEATLIAEQAKDAMREQAQRDGLTSIWNRRAIFEIASREHRRAASEALPLCIIMADLDHFKKINDGYGHQCGDAVLQEITRRFAASLRPNDFVGRYGGEELMIVLPISTTFEGMQRAEDLLRAVNERAVCAGPHEIRVTCSFGVAASMKATLEELISAADEALYEAKAAGRNCVRGAGGYASESSRMRGSVPGDQPHFSRQN